MERKFLQILQSCDTAHDIKKELSKPFGWIRFIDKIKYNKLIEKIEYYINSLRNEKWNIEYLFKIQYTIICYKSKLESYMTDFYIEDFESKEYDPSKFLTTYFQDKENNRIVSLDIESENINFSIMDTKTGNSFSVSSTREISQSQHKIEEFCKNIFVNMVYDYLHENTKKF